MCQKNIVLDMEKFHLMVKTSAKFNLIVKMGISLGHKILGRGIQVDKEKLDVISMIPLPFLKG